MVHPHLLPYPACPAPALTLWGIPGQLVHITVAVTGGALWAWKDHELGVWRAVLALPPHLRTSGKTFPLGLSIFIRQVGRQESRRAYCLSGALPAMWV